ncbi:hypothetical protein NPIL_584661, partial [Nephila pilipes]
WEQVLMQSVHRKGSTNRSTWGGR